MSRIKMIELELELENVRRSDVLYKVKPDTIVESIRWLIKHYLRRPCDVKIDVERLEGLNC